MAKRYPIDLKLSGTADASGEITLRTHDFRPGGLVCIQRVAVRCHNNSSLVAHVSLERQNEKLYLDTLKTTTGLQVARMKGPVYAPSDYGVCAEVSSVDASDLVEVYVFGYWTDFPE